MAYSVLGQVLQQIALGEDQYPFSGRILSSAGKDSTEQSCQPAAGAILHSYLEKANECLAQELKPKGNRQSVLQ